jgi:hypothetical protein
MPSEIKYTKTGAENDFNLLIAKSQEEMYKTLGNENSELRDCLKQLQSELF